jgi:uncharacterized protein
MCAIELEPGRTSAKSWVPTTVIDTDVHETLKGGHAALVPYLPPLWQRYVSGEGGIWNGLLLNQSYPLPTGKAAARADWLLEDGTTGTDPSALCRHLFDEAGVSVAVLNGFFHASRLDHDYEFAIALCAAYNDWQVDHWLSHDPRIKGSVHIVAHRPEEAAREIDRMAAHPQVVQVFLPTVTNREYGDRMYDPIWAAATRNDLAVAFHHGGHTQTVIGYPQYFATWHMIAAPHANQAQLAGLIFQGVFDRFPALKVLILETGVTWVPSFIWRADQQYRELRATVPWVKRMPSEHVRDNVRISTQPTEIPANMFEELIRMAGLESVYVFSSDYPHWDADSPADALGGLCADLRRAIAYENALDAYPRLRQEFA